VVAERLAGAKLYAPTLLGFELANICLVKRRRHPAQAATLLAAYRLRGRLGIEEVAVEPEAVLALAEAKGLTAYDAAYLWLAQRLGAELVTLDRQLAAATG
jgi:predicted nucleic acid-binding protein